MLAPADAALYAAKRRGRDCWTQVRLSPVAASEEQGPQPSASIPEQAMAHGRTPFTMRRRSCASEKKAGSTSGRASGSALARRRLPRLAGCSTQTCSE